MFENRVKLLLVLFGLPMLLIVGRLVQLQVLRAGDYQEQARQMLYRPARYYPCLRGSIQDRQGCLLAYDSESWEVCFDYGVLSGEPRGRRRSLKRLGYTRLGDLARDIEQSWRVISDVTGVPVDALQARGERIVQQVRTIKEHVAQRRGMDDVEIREEFESHPVVRGLNQQQCVTARNRLAPFPWLEVVASQSRQYEGGAAVGHLLGRLGEVTSDDLQSDPGRSDPLISYEPEDLRGVEGAEALGDQWLTELGGRWIRGRRGRIHEDREKRALEPPIAPVNGRTLRLTLDLAMQQALYNRLASAVSMVPTSTGGSAVVLDIGTREVLAAVSYPSMDPNAYANWEQRRLIADSDPLGKPALSRALGGNYPPGSIVKPMLSAIGLAEGIVTADTTFHCMGRLFADYPDRWRCTGTHGSIAAVAAIQHSCNVYFYALGQRIGTERMQQWFPRFGLGVMPGTGMPEEKARPLRLGQGVGAARNVAVGQGRLTITPLQAASMTATVASGEYRSVTMWLDDPRPRPVSRLAIPASAWRVVREGMFEAVNRVGGTAFQKADTRDYGDWVLLGKTGSAEAPPRVPGEDSPTHGWFVGYLAPRDRYLADRTGGELALAIAVVIEYGGHGGEAAAEPAADMLRAFILQQRGQVATDTISEGTP